MQWRINPFTLELNFFFLNFKSQMTFYDPQDREYLKAMLMDWTWKFPSNYFVAKNEDCFLRFPQLNWIDRRKEGADLNSAVAGCRRSENGTNLGAIDDHLGRDAKPSPRKTGFLDANRCRTRLTIGFLVSVIVGMVFVHIVLCKP